MKNITHKQFLSEDHDEFGSIAWWVTDTYLYRSTTHPRQKGGGLRIADCTRAIELDFDYDGYDQYQARLKKLDCLLAELAAFRTELENSWGRK